MAQLRAILLVLLMVAAPVAGQVDPNRRDQPEMLGNDDFVSAAIGDFNRKVVAATLDPQPSPGAGLVTENLHTNVWFLWDDDGARLQAGDADAPGCDISSPLDDPEGIATLCDGDAVDVAVSQAGDRALVASHVGASRSRLLQITAQQGMTKAISIEGLIQEVDLDGPGDLMAVAVAGTGGEVPHRVLVMGWLNTDRPIVELLLDDAPTTIDISTDGSLVVFTAQTAHRLLIPDGTATHASAIEATATDVAVASDAAHWSVAAYANGQVAGFDSTDSAKQDFSRHPANAAQVAVAIKEDATAFAAGDEDGGLRYYTIDKAAKAASLAQTIALDGEVTDLQFSRNGEYLVVSSSLGEVALFGAGDKLESIWADRLPGSVAAVDLDADGEVVLAAAGSQVYVYEALHELLPQPLNAVTLRPGETRSFSVGYQNMGNRHETATIQAGFPDGWFAQADPSTLEVPLGGQAETSIRVTVAEFAPPGRYTVPIQHTLAGQIAGETSLPIDVMEVRGWALAAGAPSKAVQPGGSVTFDAYAENLGNVAASTRVSVSVNRAGWAASVSPSNVEVEPGETGNLTITLQAPATAEELDEATVTIRLDAAPAETFDFTGKVGAAFQVTLKAPGASTVVQGQSVLIPITVQNDGNAPDTFDVAISGLPILWNAVFETGLTSHRFVAVEPGDQATVNLKVQAPPTADVNETIVLRATARSLGDPGQVDSRTFLIGVEAADLPAQDDGGKQSPGAAIGLLILAVALLAQRKRTGRAPLKNRKG